MKERRSCTVENLARTADARMGVGHARISGSAS